MSIDTQSDVQVRWLIRRDMAEILEIERASFGLPWTDEDFMRCMRQRNCIGMVAERTKQIVGFMLYELNGRHLNLLNFAVAPDVRRSGIGRQMVEKLKSKLCLVPERRNRIVADVRETNDDMHLFLRSMGFIATGVIHKPWEESTDDAYRFEFFA